MDKILVIQLSEREWNYVLQVLQQRPFAEVNMLIAKMVGQTSSQLNPKPKDDDDGDDHAGDRESA